MSSLIIHAVPDPRPDTGGGIRRRDLGTMGAAGAAALALAGCGPDRGGLKPDELQVDDSGAVELSQIPEWSTAIVNFGGQRAFVAVVREVGEKIHGFEAYCTHQGCAVSPQGDVLHCPCHGSTFDSATGAVKGGPAQSPLVPVELTVSDGKVRRV